MSRDFSPASSPRAQPPVPPIERRLEFQTGTQRTGLIISMLGALGCGFCLTHDDLHLPFATLVAGTCVVGAVGGMMWAASLRWGGALVGAAYGLMAAGLLRAYVRWQPEPSDIEVVVLALVPAAPAWLMFKALRQVFVDSRPA